MSCCGEAGTKLYSDITTFSRSEAFLFLRHLAQGFRPNRNRDRTSSWYITPDVDCAVGFKLGSRLVFDSPGNFVPYKKSYTVCGSEREVEKFVFCFILCLRLKILLTVRTVVQWPIDLVGCVQIVQILQCFNQITKHKHCPNFCMGVEIDCQNSLMFHNCGIFRKTEVKLWVITFQPRRSEIT